MIANSFILTIRSGDQSEGGMPAEMVYRKHQTRFMLREQFKRAAVLLSDTTSGDDVREIEIRLS